PVEPIYPRWAPVSVMSLQRLVIEERGGGNRRAARGLFTVRPDHRPAGRYRAGPSCQEAGGPGDRLWMSMKNPVGCPGPGERRQGVMAGCPHPLSPSIRSVADMADDVLNIDLESQSFLRNPFPTLTRLREAGPVVQVKLPFLGKTRLLTTYEAVHDAL